MSNDKPEQTDMATVTVTPRVREGPPMTGSKPFGRTLFGGIDQNSIRITTRCSAPQPNTNPDAPQNRNKICTCRLDTVSFDANFVIQFNPRKIENGWLDWETKDAYVRSTPRKPNDCKLDRANVEIHERSHIDDIIKKIKEEIEEMIRRNQNDYVCQRQCRLKDRCLDDLRRMIANRIVALGNAAWDRLTSHAEAHYRESDTERTARDKQCQDFRNRLQENREKAKEKPKKKPQKKAKKR
jgi:hypothetical protein